MIELGLKVDTFVTLGSADTETTDARKKMPMIETKKLIKSSRLRSFRYKVSCRYLEIGEVDEAPNICT